MKKKIVPVLAALILIAIVAAIGVVTKQIEKYTPTDERADQQEYFNLTEDNQMAIIMQNELMEEKGLFEDGQIYIGFDLAKEYLNDRLYWDANENVLLYTTPTDIISAEVGSKDYYVTKAQNSVDYVIVKVDGDQVYVALDYVKQYSDIEYSYFEDPNRVQITYEWSEAFTYMNIKKSIFVRYQGGVKSPILTDVAKGDKVFLLEKMEEWSKIRTEDGFIGYIQNKYLENETSEVVTRNFEEPVYTNISKDFKINLAWHQVTNQDANDTLLNVLADTKGINVISPTWFKLSDNEGNISSIASKTYVERAHQMGVEVWALVDDFSEEIDRYEILSYTTKREKIINSLIAAAIEYDLDGLNIDFEKISEETSVHFVEFIRELSIKCRNNGIVLSIDNYVPTYTSYYNRTEQGTVADYVIIMGYDENTGSSQKAGSVASIGFVEDGIKRTLEEVPAEKLINAVPFFTKLWIETMKTEEQVAAEDAQQEYIPYTLDYQNIGMDAAEQFLVDYGATAAWDAETGQNYAKVETEEATYEIWLEDEASIEEKMKLIKEYDLAGVAEWKLGYEKQSIWDVIIKYIN